MSPEAKRKAAFVTNEGLFQFRVMPFGLCNAPVLTIDGPCVVWDALVPLSGVFGRRHLIRKIGAGSTYASRGGADPVKRIWATT